MNPRSAKRGKRISAASVGRVSGRGFWLSVDGRELFMAFRHFPYFRHATIAELVNVARPAPWRLRWPRLDVELELESIEYPERYPLVSRIVLARIRDRARAGARAVSPRRRAS